jgi:hypothetical protein
MLKIYAISLIPVSFIFIITSIRVETGCLLFQQVIFLFFV